MKRRTPITQYCHERIQQMIKEPLLCIDATAGTGKDTVFLAKLVGERGRVISMDIQEMAIEQTKKRLLKERLSNRAEVVLDSHVHMDKYAKKDRVSLIMFNLGYLPGGDHSLSTKADTTIEALEKGLNLLHEGGMISLLIYSGGDSGFEEKNQVLAWLRELPDDKYTVLVEAFYNKPNNPPLPVYILKNEMA
uniref:class I SAM-dependent methyltransferase n=1 Tax=Anaerobutyricum hallii TaxID=39488 RepID=UPI0040258B16